MVSATVVLLKISNIQSAIYKRSTLVQGSIEYMPCLRQCITLAASQLLMIKGSLLVIIILTLVVLGYYYYPEVSLPAKCNVDSIVVFKSKHELLAFSDGKLLKVYKISLGGNPFGHKVVEGDRKTPEGSYFIDSKNPNSGYHKNLGISYPNKIDVFKATRMGQSPGGQVKIHGLKNGTGYISKFHRFRDWTNGCIALTDKEVDELYFHVNVGTPINIFP